MELIDQYLKAVRLMLLFMPRAHKDDIIKELGEDLRSQIEVRETELGHPLAETEQEAILKRYGHPLLVASRYRGGKGSLAFGRVLIGPELFPYYLTILCINFAVTIGLFLVIDIIGFIGGIPASRIIGGAVKWPGLLLPLLVQLIVITAFYIALDCWKYRWTQRVMVRTSSLPPPGWQTILGIVIWSMVALWWAFVRLFPMLVFGRQVTNLRLGPAWLELFLPMLLLLLAGIVQRAIYLARPNLFLFHAGMRLLVNLLALIFLYGMRGSRIFVAVADKASDPARAGYIAQAFNGAIFWGLLSWAWIYLGINLFVYVSVAVAHLRRHRNTIPSD